MTHAPTKKQKKKKQQQQQQQQQQKEQHGNGKEKEKEEARDMESHGADVAKQLRTMACLFPYNSAFEDHFRSSPNAYSTIARTVEHTPTTAEWTAIYHFPMVLKFFEDACGGIKEIRRVVNTRKLSRFPDEALVTFSCPAVMRSAFDLNLPEVQGKRCVSGFIVYVGRPTGVMLLPQLWLEDKKSGEWTYFCSDFTETHSMLLIPRRASLLAELERAATSADPPQSKAITAVQTHPGRQQSAEQFKATGLYGTTTTNASFVYVTLD